MRKYPLLGAIAASALVMASPLTAEAATIHVLTVGKTGGTAVKTGAVLKAGLVKGSVVKFSIPAGTLTCKSSSFSAKVTTNPAKPGTASESLTALTVSKCTASVSGVTVKSVVAGNLPYNVTVSDKKGDPVKVSGRSKSKPLMTTVTLGTIIGTVVCSYATPSISGNASNKTNSISFVKQKFTKVAGISACGTTAMASASFGPVVDSSVTGSPKVFVN